ncbi:MAG: cysteine--tRNA ligase [Candidatus Woesearchaeota archaeon]
MALKFYNTLTRKKELFKPIKKNVVHMYSCGPTVYNHVHIGNLRAYVFVDLLRRYLKYKGYKLKHVMNITDVEDKIIRDSQKQGKSIKDFTEPYTKSFLKDIETLNIEKPEIMPKATDSIKGMVNLVKVLLDKGIAYKTDNGDIYYKISKFKDYGKLACLDIEGLKKNADGRLDNSDEYEKEDARDFALWKAYDKEDGDNFWDTEIGKGRPGWHIECSAMSAENLGQPFDIHTGGVDLIFPHHTNEIAQSEGAYGKKFVNYWIHNAHLIVNGQKMSKSLGNYFTLKDLIDKGYKPRAIRYELIATNYRVKLDFREDNLKKLPETLDKFSDFLKKLEIVKGKEDNKKADSLIKKAKDKFEKEMDNDLNISGALAAIFEFMNAVNKIMDKISASDAKKIIDLMQKFDTVLGVMDFGEGDLGKEIQDMIDKREKARKSQDFDTADKIRDKLKKKGIELKDTRDGVIWKKIS